MKILRNHIILMGFKHVGKSAVGKQLAEQMGVPFIDLDRRIEEEYSRKFGEKRSCRDIMEAHGEKFFRLFETKLLEESVEDYPSIISLGGGTPLHPHNQRILAHYILVHVTAPKGIVFERIVLSGRPAFFDPNENLLESFQKLWKKREAIYEKLKAFSISNDRSVQRSVDEIMQKLQLAESGK